jgi:hypothetical protein
MHCVSCEVRTEFLCSDEKESGPHKDKRLLLNLWEVGKEDKASSQWK